MEVFYFKSTMVSTYFYSLGDECQTGNYQIEKIGNTDPRLPGRENHRAAYQNF